MSYLDQLKLITAWDIVPELTEDELNGLLGKAATKDAAGHAPTNVDWTPTYDLNTAAAAAWLIKAARAAATTEVAGTDPPVVTSKVFDNCRAMARIYAAKRTSTISISDVEA
jgi:hypothetical protein